MDKFFNKIVEKVIGKSMTCFQRELVKGFILLVIGIVTGGLIFISSESSFDWSVVIFMFYPIGLYYGWSSIKKIISNVGRSKVKVNSHGNPGITGLVIGLYFVGLLLAIFVGWIIGLFKFIKTLYKYKGTESKEGQKGIVE
ncbi:hypothetical protein [Dethiothermospora halolimnae]|uniref:hypothetical protein n=1 Tax=Dethiothermospora halolimnae TaxID=3114390 RepID=UPI003CCBDFCC